ncbi:MAG: DUF5916 domain-containing protein [Gemmatimonadales bacterium]|jgi:hypothetical protein
MFHLLALAAFLQAQQLAMKTRAATDDPHNAPANVARAVRAALPPVIDGRDDDAVWANATTITAFREWRPTENAEPRFRTEAKIAYDASYLYVFVRAYDPHPDSIIKILARRDTWTASDMIWVMVDSYHDHRNGYEFGVNAAGVKLDQAIYDDGNEDGAWDAVWDVATRIDSLGWTAEYRIPLSQMRYGGDSDHTFGIAILRDLYRYSERYSWPLLQESHNGLVSQFGQLTGLVGLEAPRRLEAAPYLVTKNASEIRNNAFTRGSDATIGGDLKYRVASNLTLDATINPDFGQVESDPAVLNLTAYESFFDERRPFFVAGRGLFQFNVDCSQVNCNNEQLFYSRRIGRTPELAGAYGDTTAQQPTTILGAAKLTGRLPGGLTLGFMDAVTQRDRLRADTTVEPGTNYAALRLRQDLRGGNSNVGLMFTGVNRNNDAFTSPYLSRSAYAGAVDFMHRFWKNNWQISGSVDLSRVAGSRQAIASLQEDAVHYYQRPDAGLPLDTMRTALSGDAEELHVAKYGGQHLLFESAYMRRSAGFEINDAGYLQRADQQTWSTWVGFFDRRKTKFYQRFQWNMNWWQYWTTNGLPLEAAYNTNLHVTLNNSMGLHVGGTYGQLGSTYCDRCARGGPAVRQDPYIAPWAGINGDDRKPLVPYLWVNYWSGDGGRSHSLNLSPELDLRVSSRFSSVLSLNWSRNRYDAQWYGNFTDGTGAQHYTFAHLDQTTVGLVLRLNYTLTPAMSLQVYAQPFDSKGTYTNVRELSATPRAAGYDQRFAAYGDTAVTSHPGGFNYKQFASNVVFRWEYKPGSTLFLVWNQGRQGVVGAEGNGNFQTDMRALFALHPMNTFLVKVSYWLNY